VEHGIKLNNLACVLLPKNFGELSQYQQLLGGAYEVLGSIGDERDISPKQKKLLQLSSKSYGKAASVRFPEVSPPIINLFHFRSQQFLVEPHQSGQYPFE
jgi:hypothetical protein